MPTDRTTERARDAARPPPRCPRKAAKVHEVQPSHRRAPVLSTSRSSTERWGDTCFARREALGAVAGAPALCGRQGAPRRRLRARVVGCARGEQEVCGDARARPASVLARASATTAWLLVSDTGHAPTCHSRSLDCSSPSEAIADAGEAGEVLGRRSARLRPRCLGRGSDCPADASFRELIPGITVSQRE